jgi:biotin transport system substrate-specific component
MDARALTVPSFVVAGRLGRRSAVRSALLVVAASLLLALSARIAVPFLPVPMTLQPLALLVIGTLLGSRLGAAAAGLYLLEGLVGLPVFALGRGGVGHLLGPTAGYLFAFPVAAWIAGRVAESAWGRSFWRAAVGFAGALAVVHLGGWSWLASVAGLGPGAAWNAGVAPFLAGDLVKVAFAASLAPLAQRWIAQSNER